MSSSGRRSLPTVRGRADALVDAGDFGSGVRVDRAPLPQSVSPLRHDRRRTGDESLRCSAVDDVCGGDGERAQRRLPRPRCVRRQQHLFRLARKETLYRFSLRVQREQLVPVRRAAPQDAASERTEPLSQDSGEVGGHFLRAGGQFLLRSARRSRSVHREFGTKGVPRTEVVREEPPSDPRLLLRVAGGSGRICQTKPPTVATASSGIERRRHRTRTCRTPDAPRSSPRSGKTTDFARCFSSARDFRVSATSRDLALLLLLLPTTRVTTRATTRNNISKSALSF
jgi:hypothetical protein